MTADFNSELLSVSDETGFSAPAKANTNWELPGFSSTVCLWKVSLNVSESDHSTDFTSRATINGKQKLSWCCLCWKWFDKHLRNLLRTYLISLFQRVDCGSYDFCGGSWESPLPVFSLPRPISLTVAKCWDPTPRSYFTIPRGEYSWCSLLSSFGAIKVQNVFSYLLISFPCKF